MNTKLQSFRRLLTIMDELRERGMIFMFRYKTRVSGLYPLSNIDELDSCLKLLSSNLAFHRLHVGLVTSQADETMNTRSLRETFNIDGTGISVGILSDSFNCLGGMQTDINTGDLPTISIEQANLSSTYK